MNLEYRIKDDAPTSHWGTIFKVILALAVLVTAFVLIFHSLRTRDGHVKASVLPNIASAFATAPVASPGPNLSAVAAPATLTDMSECAAPSVPAVSAEAMAHLEAFVASVAPDLSEDGRADLRGYLAATGAALNGSGNYELSTTLRNDRVYYVVKTTGCTKVPVTAKIVPYDAKNGGAP